VRKIVNELRQAIAEGASPDFSEEGIIARLEDMLATEQRPTLIPVLNLTGTVLHTNLGRASLPEAALKAIHTVSIGNSNLEFELESGERGDRDSHVEQLVCELTGAEAATVVNNNAAAVLLVLNTLAMGKEVPVSRGELVEIGGSFRIPEVMKRSGCSLVEIGATNRTHLKDYEEALSENTAVLLKVHTSNYQIQGFTLDVSDQELAKLAHRAQLPLVIDLGSGNLMDFEALGLPAEKTVADAISNGADVVTFSGDKLLGGPQAGVIAGRKDLIAQIKKNPLKRALRLDKMTLVGLAEVLKLYRDPLIAMRDIPTLRHLVRQQPDIRSQAKHICSQLQGKLAGSFSLSVEDCSSQIGSGSLPVDTLPSAALCIRLDEDSGSRLNRLASQLRKLPLPVIGRIHKNAIWLDLRCMEESQESEFIEQICTLTL
jgi:L-seryl-tRNA(Ser) seleniumtransferase